jgi:hypothetical protein
VGFLDKVAFDKLRHRRRPTLPRLRETLRRARRVLSQYPDDIGTRVVFVPVKQKSLVLLRGFFDKVRRRPTLPGVIPVPLARVVLTALFGMGRGGPHRNSHLNVLVLVFTTCVVPTVPIAIGITLKSVSGSR